jgi:hypothetical protein
METQIESSRRVFRRTVLPATVLVIAVALAACAGVQEEAGETREGAGKLPGQQPAASAPSTEQAAPPATRTPKARAGTATPIPARPLSVRSDCTARDQTGYTESIRLTVDQGRVDLLEANIKIPRHGSCGFHLSDFYQTRAEPHVELRSRSGTKCTVRMWQQEGRFTVAFSDCQDKCTRGAFDYVWPMDLKMADGSCL